MMWLDCCLTRKSSNDCLRLIHANQRFTKEKNSMQSSTPPKSMRFVLLPLILFSFSLICYGQSGWSPELEMKVNAVGAVRVSPDARKVVYTVNSSVMTAEKSEFVSQIWVANTDGSEQVQLTYAEKSSENPQWSPDSKMIAFTSNRSGKTN